jgi:hypothetical protein
VKNLHFSSFDWSNKEPIPSDDSKTVQLIAKSNGTAHAVFMWWTLDMDTEGEIVLSCAPPWAHPEGIVRCIRERDVDMLNNPSSILQEMNYLGGIIGCKLFIIYLMM